MANKARFTFVQRILLACSIFMLISTLAEEPRQRDQFFPDSVAQEVQLQKGFVPNSTKKTMPFSKVVFYFRDSKKIGERAWDEQGKLVYEKQEKDGKQNGLFRGYYENGSLSIEYACINELREGNYTKWHSNGKMAEQLNYHNDEPHGVFRHWDESGRRIKVTSETYYHGKLIGIYNVNGKTVNREEFAKATIKDITLPPLQNDDN